MSRVIRVRPARARRRAFAQWAAAQKVRTCSETEFAVPEPLYVRLAEELLIGSQVDGHAYVPVADEPAELAAEPVARGAVPTAVPEVPPVPTAPDAAPSPADQDQGHGEAPQDAATLEDRQHADCAVCGRTFASARGVEVHHRMSHRDNTGPEAR